MTLITLLFSLIQPSFAAETATKGCFDFSTKITAPLKEGPTTFDAKKDPSDLKEGDEKNSANISGIVEKPISEIYQMLIDPRTIRPDPDTKITVKETESKDYLKRITQSIEITPVFFLTLRWNEEWVYALKDGTDKAPKTLVISYEKTSGTAHIQRLCGNIVLRSLTPKTTGVYLYEEMKADRREAKDILHSITGTLRTLRGIPEKADAAE